MAYGAVVVHLCYAVCGMRIWCIVCYGMCGTELAPHSTEPAYGGTVYYGMCGTMLAYGAIVCYGICGTELARAG
eukprot:3936230-Rhodomonas_salina.1